MTIPQPVEFAGRSAWLRCWAGALAAAFLLTGSSLAQESPAPSPAVANSAELRERLEEVQAHRQEAKGQLETFPPDASSEERAYWRDRLELLDDQIASLQRQITLLTHLSEQSRAIASARTVERLEPRLAQPPPYPLALAEHLYLERTSQQAKLEAAELRRQLLTADRDDLRAHARELNRQYRRSLEARESATTPQADQTARFTNELTTIAREVNALDLAYLDTRLSQTDEEIRFLRSHVDRLDRELRRIVNALDPDPDALRTRIEKLEAERQSLETETEAMETVSSQVVEKLDRTIQQQGSGDDIPAVDARLKLLRKAAELNVITEDSLSLHAALAEAEISLLRERAALFEDWNRNDAKRWQNTIQDFYHYVDQVERVSHGVEGERQAASELVAQGDADPEAAAILQEALERNREQILNTSKALTKFRTLLHLWEMELAGRIETADGAERISSFFDWLGTQIGRLWQQELFSIEDTLMIDGEQVVERRPVTVSKVVLAIVILIVGLIIANRLAQLLCRILLPFREHKSRLLVEKVIGFGLTLTAVLVALMLVRIPLTVFAFLGGALAIAVGFGAQNLINNFLSSFLILSERPIRVGDTIEYEGQRAKVLAIGNRCTQVRRFDGVEILIPNSQILEQSVSSYTYSDSRVRRVVRCAFDLQADSRQVHEILAEVAAEHPDVLEEPPPLVLFEEYGEAALIFELNYWVDVEAVADSRIVGSDLRHRLQEKLKDTGIRLALPRREWQRR